jgi:O-antigen ligase
MHPGGGAFLARGMTEHSDGVPSWLLYLDLACAVLAGALWVAFPQAGPWPLTLALAPWVLRLVWTGRLTRRTQFDLLLGTFLLTAGISVCASYDHQAAWHKFWLIVGGMLIFYALVNAEPVGEARGWLLAGFGAAVALYFVATNEWQAYEAKIEVLGRLGYALQAPLSTLPGPRLHPNMAGGIMAMMLPFAGLGTLRAWHRGGRSGQPLGQAHWLRLVASLGLLVVTLFGLLMTVSRAAWIAVAGALALASLWVAAGWISRSVKIRRAWVFAGLLGLGLVVVVGVGLAWPGSIVAALEALPGKNTAYSRLDLLLKTVTLVRDYPFVGAGLGGFQMLYSTYAMLIHVGYTIHSHNSYLDVAVEQGIPALLALVGMWLLFGLAVWRGVSQPATRRRSWTLGAAALSLLVLLLHGLVDHVLYSAGLLLLFVPLAFAVSPIRERRMRHRRRVSLALPIGLILLLAMVLLWWRPLLSLVFSNLGAVHQSQAELSVYSWPEWRIQDEVRRQVDLRRPVAEFERALAMNPRNATANRRLGMIELALGEYEAALRHLEAAYAVEPASMTTQQLLGEAYLANGRLEEGQALWDGVSNEQRQLVMRLGWYRHIGDVERAEWVRQAVSGHP